MISLGSLAAFSSSPATGSVGPARPAAATANVVLARAQGSGSAPAAQTAAPTISLGPNKNLPRGSLLDLQV